MNLRKLSAGLAVVTALALAPEGQVKADVAIPASHLAYGSVETGMRRHHVEAVLAQSGVRVVMYADEAGFRHIIKDYTVLGGYTAEVAYVGPPSAHRFAGPMRVVGKVIS